MGMKYKDDKLLIDGVDVGNSLLVKYRELSFDSFILGISRLQDSTGLEQYDRKTMATSRGYLLIDAGATFICNEQSIYKMKVFLYDAPDLNTFKEVVSVSSSGYTLTQKCYVRIEVYIWRDSQLQDITDISEFNGKYVITGHYYEEQIMFDATKKRLLSRIITNNVSAPYVCNAPYFNVISGDNHVENLYSAYDTLMNEYPSFVTKEVLGKDASSTYDIIAYTINPHTVRPDVNHRSLLKIVLLPNIHGNEYEAAASDYVFVKELLGKCNTDDVMALLWANCEFVVIPTCNPWGLDNLSAGRMNANGVNLNRNFPYDWVYFDPSDTYNFAGNTPADQPETQILMKFIYRHRDAFIMTNRHTSGGMKKDSALRQYGYATSKFVSDNDVTAAVGKEIDAVIKKNNPWLFTDDPDIDKIALFRYQNATNHGCMDAYFNSLGIHGSIFEWGQYDFTDYPNMNIEKVQKIDVTITANLLKAYVMNNNYILSNSMFEGQTIGNE